MIFQRLPGLVGLLLGLIAAPGLTAQRLAPAANQPVVARQAAPFGQSVVPPLLPAAFAGEPRDGDIVVDPTPTDIDSAHADVLKEDGMVQAASAQYASLGRRGWTLQAIRFGDTTGAFAAFTFYRTPEMRTEIVGDAAAALPEIFLVQSGAQLVIARAAANAVGGPARGAESLLPELRVLVAHLPRIHGPSAIPPPLPGLLPRPGLEATSLHYALGPAGYNGPLPASLLGFRDDAEVATAAYHLPRTAPATLTLDMLPTPELAAEALKQIHALPDAPAHVAVRRLGSLVAVVSGNGVAPAAAEALLAKLHYAPAVTLDIARPQQPNQVAQTAQLLVVVAEFTGLMAVCAVLLAAFFGFGRVYLRRLQGKPDSSLNDEQFISLKLK